MIHSTNQSTDQYEQKETWQRDLKSLMTGDSCSRCDGQYAKTTMLLVASFDLFSMQKRKKTERLERKKKEKNKPENGKTVGADGEQVKKRQK